MRVLASIGWGCWGEVMAGDGASERDTRHGRRFRKGSFLQMDRMHGFDRANGDLRVEAQGHLGTASYSPR